MKRWNHFTKFPYEEDTLVNNWRMLVYRNFDKTIRILIELSENLECVICQDLSLNYTTKPSLANHYLYVHKRKTTDYFLDYVATKTPDELEGSLN